MPPSDNRSNAPLPDVSRKEQQKLRMKAILLSFAVGLLLMGLKFLTYKLTRSSAVLSDALESIINVVASAFAGLSIWMAAKPPDPEHPYGHGKIEYFSAGFEGALIIGAAGAIFYTGLRQLLHPSALPHLQQGAAILLGATGANMLLGLFLIHTGKRTDSIALIADGKHIITDVYTSVGVIVGLGLVYISGWVWLDGAVACLVGLNILITGGRLVFQSYARLMDASDPELLDRITYLLQQNRRPGWVDIHQLRAWRAGSFIHIDLHLVLPIDISLHDAHHEAKILEQMLITQFRGNAGVLVHMDPCEAENCPICNQRPCDSREQQYAGDAVWNRHHLTKSKAENLLSEQDT